ncbi:hypothetical protein Taro_010199 [Colocasia esculenta]|uniref:arginyltransferase n=1 Tax=Colocasia esculenta TaxID=4460 RepID=A0A843U2C8_COLES|nr:hypothetical protein [Colocasia esculenta]
MGDGASSSGSRGGRGAGHSRGETVVADLGRRKSSCGYCKSSDYTSVSHGLWAYSITVDDYQDLLDRGWRRSGSHMYKPEMERTCCPSYTIRLKAADFVTSKDQERVLKRMQRFLDGKLDLKRSDQVKDEACFLGAVCSLVKSASSEMAIESPIKGDITKEDEYVHYLSKKIDDAVNTCICSDFLSAVELPKANVKKLKPQAKKKLAHLSGDLLYTSNISFQIVAVLKRHQLAQGNGSQLDVSTSGSSQSKVTLGLSPTVVAEKLADTINLQGNLSGMTINACNGYLNFCSASKGVESEVVRSSVSAQAEPSKDNEVDGKCCQLASGQTHTRRRLEIRMKKSAFDPEEYDLYRRYQVAVHKDNPTDVTESQYKRFLVDTPLVFVPSHSNSTTVPTCGFGSFHQQYRIDGKLVAVGVVDILPRCLSSKYLFWDPELAFLSLGKYSALKEIDWVKQTAVNWPSLQYYYLGYYIHSCSKMRYKAAYCPSELLCPLRFEWVPFTVARPLLDWKSYVILSDYASLQNEASSTFQLPENVNQPPLHDVHHQGHTGFPNDEDREMEIDFEDHESETDEESDPETRDVLLTLDVNNVTLEVNGFRVKFKDLRRVFGPIPKKNMDALELQLRRFANVVGTVLADRMVYNLTPSSP